MAAAGRRASKSVLERHDILQSVAPVHSRGIVSVLSQQSANTTLSV